MLSDLFCIERLRVVAKRSHPIIRCSAMTTAMVLLFVRPRAGLILCLAIIITDVVNNGWVRYHRSEVDLNYILEVAFLVFVLATIRYAWQALPQRLRNTPSSAGG